MSTRGNVIQEIVISEHDSQEVSLVSYCLHIFVVMQHFHHVVTCMRRPHGRGLDLARKHVASCLNELSLMLKSQEFLKSRSDITMQQCDESCTTASGCRPIGFDVSLNSRLLSPAPPRAFQILAWSDVSSQCCPNLRYKLS